MATFFYLLFIFVFEHNSENSHLRNYVKVSVKTLTQCCIFYFILCGFFTYENNVHLISRITREERSVNITKNFIDL